MKGATPFSLAKRGHYCPARLSPIAVPAAGEPEVDMANGVSEYEGYEYTNFSFPLSDGTHSANVRYRKVPDGIEAQYSLPRTFPTDDLAHMNARIWLQDWVAAQPRSAGG